MKILYGSQNFGYNTVNSDKDYAEILVPTWKDLFNKKTLDGTKYNEDGTQIKQIDIRSMPGLLKNGNLAITQILYSKEYNDIGFFQWFVDRRERIIRSNLYQFYIANRRIIEQDAMRELRPKDVARFYVSYKILKRLLEPDEFSIYVEDAIVYRETLELQPQEILRRQADHWIQMIDDLEWFYFDNFAFKFDEELYTEMNQYIIKVVSEASTRELLTNSKSLIEDRIENEHSDDSLQTVFASRLNEAMHAKKVSPLKLTQILGLSSKEVFQWIRGEKMPSRVSIVKLSRILGVSEQYLFGIEQRKDDGTETEVTSEFIQGD